MSGPSNVLMNCVDLFKEVIVYWPAKLKIDKSDADQLNKLYWLAESNFDSETQHWLNIGTWAFHQALGKYVNSIAAANNEIVVMSEVPIELFHEQMLFNLEDECWIQERSEYLGPRANKPL